MGGASRPLRMVRKRCFISYVLGVGPFRCQRRALGMPQVCVYRRRRGVRLAGTHTRLYRSQPGQARPLNPVAVNRASHQRWPGRASILTIDKR